jgi:aspartate/methionine/tyrosine aminotransferase
MEFDILKKTPLYEALSDRGKRIYLPEGIFYWAGRAKKEAEYIGTIGAAYAYEKDFLGGYSDSWVPCYLEHINDYFSNLDINDLVPYASVSGLEELRTIWKNWIKKKSLFKKDTEEEKLSKLEKYTSLPIITAGVTNAIFMSSAMLLNPSESIICPNKRWGNYDNIFSKFLGVNIQSFDFFVDDKLNLEGLKEAIYKVVETQNKIILILGFPNNPTGFIPTWEENAQLIEILKE